MKVKAFALASLGTAVLAGTATADFVELKCEEFVGAGWVNNGYAGLVTYRLFANFDGTNPDDGVISVFGLAGIPLSVNSTDGSFHNTTTMIPFPPFGVPDSNFAPQDLTPFYFDNQWDTYVTIGVTDSTDDATQADPLFDTSTNSLSGNFSLNNGGWFVTPDDGQSIVGGDGKFLIGQFTVAAGEGISGVLNLALRGGTTVEQLAFSTGTPAPGALALLGLAGLAGTRRRRA